MKKTFKSLRWYNGLIIVSLSFFNVFSSEITEREVLRDSIRPILLESSNSEISDFPLNENKKKIILKTTAAFLNSIGIGCAMVPIYLGELEKENVSLNNYSIYPIAVTAGLVYGIENLVNKFFFQFENNKKWWASQFLGAGNGLLHTYYLYQVEAGHGFGGEYALFFGVLSPFVFFNETLNSGETIYSFFENKKTKKIIEFINSASEETINNTDVFLENINFEKTDRKLKNILSFLYPVVLSPFATVIIKNNLEETFNLEPSISSIITTPFAIGACALSYKIIQEIQEKDLKNFYWVQSCLKTSLHSLFAFNGLKNYNIGLQASGTILFSLPFLLTEQKSINNIFTNVYNFIKDRRTFKKRKWLIKKAKELNF